jgi:hypothetical protein
MVVSIGWRCFELRATTLGMKLTTRERDDELLGMFPCKVMNYHLRSKTLKSMYKKKASMIGAYRANLRRRYIDHRQFPLSQSIKCVYHVFHYELASRTFPRCGAFQFHNRLR